MIAEHENAVLTVDLPRHGLLRGDVGVVVMVHEDRGYEVEFTTLDGRTVAVVSVDRSQVQPVDHGEIAHARSVEAV